MKDPTDRPQVLKDKLGQPARVSGFGIDITERKQAKKQLRNSEMNLRTTIDTIPAFIFSALPDGSFEFASQSWFDYSGLSPEEIYGWDWATVVHPEDRDRAVEIWRESLATGEPRESEHRVRQANGEYRWFLARNLALRDEKGHIARWYVVLVDIENQKQAEELLRNSERNLRSTIDTIPAFIFSALPDGTLDFTNQSWVDYSGHTPREILGWEWVNLVHPEDRDRAVKKWRKCLATGEPTENQFRMRLASEEYRWFLARYTPMRDDKGNIVKWFGAVIDIENQKQAEEQLRNSERNLRTTIDTIPAFVFSALPDGFIDFANKVISNYTGLKSEELLGMEWEKIVHPEDRNMAVENWRESVATGEPREDELRLRQANGEYHWFLARNAALRDDKGNIVKWYGAVIDIEKQKRAEEQLRNSERNLRATIETIPAFVFSALPDGSIDFVSQSLLDYLGLSPEAALGWDWTTLVHPEDSDRVGEKWHDWRESLAKGEQRGSERRFRQANGEYRWFLARKSALRDEKGNIVKWYGVLVDIEEQKRAEARLLQALDEIQKLQEQLSKENIVLREEVDRISMFEEIVGASPALKAVLARIDKVAPTDTVILITGETGTGKELVARAIHKRSPRSSRAFMSVNCAAIPAPLISSELFGHEKGAFTGAHQRRFGCFELVNGGTIFLDEIGEVPMETQIALLRVLQDQEFQRLGGNRAIRANARVIAATNRDLQAAIEAGSFRRDLFYRLNVFPIEIPPLRERKEDIPILVEYFINRYASKLGKKIRSASRKTLDLLQSYSWPGNIRELQNVIERSIILCDTENFSVDENFLPRESRPAQPVGQTLPDMLVSKTKEMIEAALAESGGRVSGPSGAAAKLGMRSSTLEAKIKALKINKYLFKKPI
jgi:PAS domain S-box-containing protein